CSCTSCCVPEYFDEPAPPRSAASQCLRGADAAALLRHALAAAHRESGDPVRHPGGSTRCDDADRRVAHRPGTSVLLSDPHLGPEGWLSSLAAAPANDTTAGVLG